MAAMYSWAVAIWSACLAAFLAAELSRPSDSASSRACFSYGRSRGGRLATQRLEGVPESPELLMTAACCEYASVSPCSALVTGAM